ncbi:MAG: DUF3307 domain-containing protein [Flavitalea sp.]
MDIAVLLRLLTAHIITDFVLQPTAWVTDKREKKFRSKYLYIHGLITGAVAYLVMWNPGAWLLPVIIMVTHILIDGWKLYRKNNLFYFIADQLIHVLIIVTAWILIYDKWDPAILTKFDWNKIWTFALAFSFVLWPTGYIVSYATAVWRKKLEAELGESLEQAGKYIGMLERTLVLIFILTNRYETIGLLIAAKSILRFSESKARKHTEYVLIGTMLSFAITLIVGLAIKAYLGK